MKATASSKRIKASRLPDEIVEEILARLPAKSLCRFQCVSQSWRHLITSPSFRDLHATRADAAHGRRLFVRRTGYCEFFYAPRVQHGSSSSSSSPDEEILSFSKFAPGWNVFPISKSCHGLVLLRCIEYNAHYVWNPSSGEILALPDRTPFKTADRMPRTFVSYGMGYCSVTKEHKVVRMYCLDVEDDEPHNAATVCEVFTLDKSTHWRPAATQPPVCRLRVRGSLGAVLCNGNLHFLGKDGVITTFNVEDETFGTLMPPPGMEYGGFDLTELDGCLCVYFGTQTYMTPDYLYRIWLRRDGCWKELRCIDWGAMTDVEQAELKSHWIAPLGMYPDDDGSNTQTKKKVMFSTGSCKVFVVDPTASKDGGIPAIIFSLDGVQHDGQFPTVGLFEESLTSVGRASAEIIFLSPSADVTKSSL